MKTDQRIITWIRKQIKAAKAKGIVMGLSGGVDSAVVAALSRKAVGKNRLLCLLLPCDSSKTDCNDSMLMVKKFNLRYKAVDVKPVFNCLCKILPTANRKAAGNLKSRLRMLTLYYFANKLNYLVAGTGNKSELLMGYFTKHGDGGVDILPIAGLLKKEVRSLAEELGIPQRIINKPPTAGLWAGQTDEAEMGITYNQLDDILYRLGNNRKQQESASVVCKVKKMIRSSEHKRRLAVICRP
ncbi:MAG: NAD+ synthase [Candidatus Omnitrophota bacterium]|nr:NAD+ synthase [Candidatus Omnitrophota bacterium]